MSANEGITHASVREFLVKNNGKVKNIDLVHHFRQQLNDPVNKSKVRGEFKEIVHTIATVQTIDGEKYFVLKKAKEAPAVLRKPPRPNTRKDRPVSLPPVFRGAKLEEMPAREVPLTAPVRSQSTDESPDLSHPNKENKPFDRSDGRDEKPLVSTGSVDSGLDSDGSGSSVGGISKSTFKMLQSQFLNSSKVPSSTQPERISRSSDELDRMDDDVEDDFLMGGISAHLEPLEKEWLVSAAKGNRAQIMCLLEQDPNLATKKDFMLGYSALHWAAKHGRADIVNLLATTGIDVNVRTNGGYTPLHLAAIHGHDDVIRTLVNEYGADINSRDHSGKKPKQVARDCLTIEAQGLLENRFRNDSDTSSESSGYGSLHSKFGSTSSTPSVMLASQYSNSEKGSKNESSEDKTRSRSSSLGKFLMKKKHKKERGQLPHFPQSSSTAGLLISTPLAVESSSFEMSPAMSQRTHSDPNLPKSTGV